MAAPLIAAAAAIALAASPCTPEPSDAPFQTHPTTSGRVLLELHPLGAPPGWAERVLTTAGDRGVPITVVLEAAKPSPLRVARPHVVAVDLRAGVPDDGLTEEVERQVRSARQQLRASTGQLPVTAYAPLPRRTVEATLALAGIRWILDAKPDPSAVLHPGARYEGSNSAAVVVPAGPFAGCGGDPTITPLSAVSLDRAAATVARAGAHGVARLVLDGASAGADDAERLGRWLDEVALPAGFQPITARALGSWRRLPPAPPTRTVWAPTTDLDEAAEVLANANPLPHRLPHDLSLTSAWIGFAVGLTAEAPRGPGQAVPLPPIEGPAADNRSALAGVTQVSRAALVGALQALLDARPSRVPSMFIVDGQTLTAGEALVLLASAWRGDDPCVTRPTLVPEPNVVGLGFGDAHHPVSPR
jgi:hypothetical protein